MIENMGSLFSWADQTMHTPEEMRSAIERRRATFVSMGVRAGERVVLPAVGNADFFVSLLALWSLRGSAVPLDTRLTEDERASLKIKSGASHFFLGEIEDLGKALPIHAWPSNQGDEALLLFTTGTLSHPRGVRLSSRAVANKISALGAKLPLSDFRKTLCVLPLSFGHGLIGNALMPWLNGCDLTVTSPLDVALAQEFPEILKSRQISFFSSVPGLWALLSRMIEPQNQNNLRRIFCASAPLAENIFREIQRLFPGVPLHNVYGLTEMASWVAVSPELANFSKGNVGFVIDGEIELNEGEIEVRGASIMTGYLGEPELSPEGWFKTGDRGDFSTDGSLLLRGRNGNIVNRGGVKVQLEEIEEILSGHKNLKEALAFKIDDAELGESFELAVVLNEDSEESRREIQDWLATRVSPQRRPARWHFMEALPINGRGKPDRTLLSARVRSYQG